MALSAVDDFRQSRACTCVPELVQDRGSRAFGWVTTVADQCFVGDIRAFTGTGVGSVAWTIGSCQSDCYTSQQQKSRICLPCFEGFNPAVEFSIVERFDARLL